MSFPTERELRRPEGVYGVEIRMGDGQIWTFPVRPLFGEIAKLLLSKLEAVWAAQEPMLKVYRAALKSGEKLAEPGEEIDLEGADELVDAYHQAVADLTYHALRVHYPKITVEHAQSLLTTQHTMPVVQAVSGNRELEEIFPSSRRSDP